MERDPRAFTPIKDILSALFREGALPFSPDDAAIWKVWPGVVGQAIASHAHPQWIKDGKLKVTVSDPIWLQELQFSESDIREKLNSALGRAAVETIAFRIGRRS